MRVKIGNDWYAVGPSTPIMIELSPADKRNISGMLPECTRYATFDDHDEVRPTPASRIAWMES